MKSLNTMNRGMEMKTVALRITLALCAVALASCMEGRPNRNYVQTNVVEKDLFGGEWYYTHTIIDNDQESTYAWAYRGSVSFDTVNSVIGTIARVRFVIDEDFLYAFRSYPLVADADRTTTGGRNIDIYEPLAAWPIDSHFDIVRRYNTESGELLNVIEENSQDRPWYERRFMRVDWSGNVITGGYNFNDLDVWDPLGYMNREATGTYIGEGSEFPGEWEPRFDFTPATEPLTAEGEPDRESWEWEYYDRYGPEQLYHFSFVTQEIWDPGVYPLLYSWAQPWFMQMSDTVPMSALLVTVRHAFLRVPDEAQFEPVPLPDSEWERFGSWRIEQPTYAWGDLPDEDGGLTNFYGQTDAMNYWAGIHNIWRRSFDYDEQGRRVPIPYAEREVQRVVYTLSEHFPLWLVQPAFSLVGEWNSALMETVRVAQGRALPDPIIDDSSCTTDQECLDEYGDVFPYTACRSDYDGTNGRCTRQYNPFIRPGHPAYREGDYDCYVVAGADDAPVDPGLDLADFDDERLESQRTWRFTGSECAMVLRNNTCDDPGALAAATEARPACANNPELCCDQMGDLRFNFLAYNDQVGLFFGGVSQPLMDPLTGELIQANANAAGLSVEGAMTYVGWYFNLVDDDPEQDALDELNMMVGEDVRALMENSSYAIPPVTPALPPRFSEGAHGGTSGQLTGNLHGGRTPTPDDGRTAARSYMPRMRRALEQAWNLRGQQGRMNVYSDRLRQLEGTTYERRLLSGAAGMAALGFTGRDPMASPTDEELELASPFRHGFFPYEQEMADLRARMLRRNFSPSADDQIMAFMDNSIVNWLREFPEGTTPQQRAIQVGRQYFRSMMLHEMGHSVGMRHNFAGSLDYNNYHDQYYRIDDQYPLPSQSDYDADGSNTLDYEEMARFNADLTEARHQRELAGVARWRSNSIMEYMPRLANELAPLGRYDRGFIHYMYGRGVEVYTTNPRESAVGGAALDRNWINRPDRTERVFQRYFGGGEPCRIDLDTTTRGVTEYHNEDCPMGVVFYHPDQWPASAQPACSTDADCQERFGDFRCDEERGWCLSNRIPEGQLVGQLCRENPRSSQTEHPEDLPGVCLNFDDSLSAYGDFMANDRNVRDVVTSHIAVSYRFCSDERTSDISWCTPSDEGENFREIVNNYRESWARSYPFRYFRRYRANFAGTSNFETFAALAKFMSHFYYRYFYEALWNVNDDRWIDSIPDHLAGAATGMNFLAEVVAQPDVGSYNYNPDTDSYEQVTSGEFDASADLDIPVGLGRYMWSQNQEGTFGIWRMERMGSFNDKLYALFALALRDWGMTYSYDERFWINFYSMFPYEMSQLFGGVVLDDPRLYGARVCAAGTENPITGEECEQTTIIYQDLWRGSTLERNFEEEDMRGNPFDDIYAEMPSIGGGNSEMLRTWAVIFSLAEFPVFYDTTFEQQMYIFVEGSGDSFEFTDCADDPADPMCLTEGEDFVRYTSDRFNLSFVSFPVVNEYAWEPPQVDTSFIVVNRARELQADIDACEAGAAECTVPSGPAREAAIEEWRVQLEATESLLFSIIDIQSIYGISSWL